jgi:hypothetical protein
LTAISSFTPFNLQGRSRLCSDRLTLNISSLVVVVVVLGELAAQATAAVAAAVIELQPDFLFLLP